LTLADILNLEKVNINFALDKTTTLNLEVTDILYNNKK
jgi:hypothetical protein